MITVIFQMFSFLIMIGVGYAITKKKMMDHHTNRQISKMIADVFNPLLGISSAINSIGLIQSDMMVKVAWIAVAMFLIFIILGLLLTPLFAKEDSQVKMYRLMFVFSNLAFIGIPLVSGVIGSEYVVYVTEFMMVYTIILYSYGIIVLEGKFSLKSLKNMVNPGIISGIIAVLIIVYEIQLPVFLKTAITYLGSIASPLALVAVGFTVAQSDLKKIFCQPKLYVFSIMKLLVIPLLMLPFLRLLQIDRNTMAVCMILFGMPVGNLPLILANERGIDASVCSSMIILSTLLCVISIPVLLAFI